MSGDNGLPLGWARASLGELGVFINGDRGKNYPSAGAFVESGVPFINAGHLRDGSIDLVDMNYITEERFNLLGSGKIRVGDVLYCLRGSLGKAAVVMHLEIGAIASSLVIIRALSSVASKYLYYYLVSPLGKYEISRYDNGSAQPNLSARNVRAYEVPVAPLNEQRRIVAKIEELFSDLDAGVAALARAKANLKRYRAAVLKAAVEGQLTAAWRAAHPDVEPASKLLQRILADRRRKWEQDQLAKFAAAGKPPPKNWEARYVDPAAPDASDLPRLPVKWCWGSVDQLSELVYRYPTFYGMPHLSTGVPVIRGEHILSNGLISTDWTDYWFVAPEVSSSFPKTVCKRGDVIMSVRGSVGKLGIVDESLTGAQVSPNCLRISLVESALIPRFFVIALKSGAGQRSIKANVNQTTIETIKAEVFLKTAIPLPSLEEQMHIVREVAEKLSQIENAEAVIEHGLARAARLRQSILKRAFSGQLVPQDPHDEPAGVLSERLRATGPAHKGNGRAASSSRSRNRGTKSHQIERIDDE